MAKPSRSDLTANRPRSPRRPSAPARSSPKAARACWTPRARVNSPSAATRVSRSRPGSRSPSRAPTDAPAAMAARLSRVPSPRTDVVVLRLVRRAGREHPPTYEPAWIGARANPAQTHQANRAAKPGAVMDDADGGRRGPRARPGPGLRRTLRDHWGLDWSAEAVDLGGSSSLNLLVGEAD